ncbi:MAG: hypothetical protein L0221_03790, partial [Chloroflexi bacterium]|nr:hypothetical protein [Chloroflexota bacterium]
KLTLTKLAAPAGDEGVAWSGMLAPLAGPLPDPVATGVRVRLADATGAALLDVTIAGGAFDKATKTGWKSKNDTTWTWQGLRAGVTKVKLVGKTPGTLKLTVTAKGASLPSTPALPLRARLVVDGATGRCGKTAFEPASCIAQPTKSKGKVVCR